MPTLYDKTPPFPTWAKKHKFLDHCKCPGYRVFPNFEWVEYMSQWGFVKFTNKITPLIIKERVTLWLRGMPGGNGAIRCKLQETGEKVVHVAEKKASWANPCHKRGHSYGASHGLLRFHCNQTAGPSWHLALGTVGVSSRVLRCQVSLHLTLRGPSLSKRPPRQPPSREAAKWPWHRPGQSCPHGHQRGQVAINHTLKMLLTSLLTRRLYAGNWIPHAGQGHPDLFLSGFAHASKTVFFFK